MIFHLFIISSAVQIYEFSYIHYHKQTVEPMQHVQPEAMASQPLSQLHLALPSDSPGDSDTSRPVRALGMRPHG